MKKRIYLDNNATTAIDPKVLINFEKSLKEIYGNPSSLHQEGQAAKRKLSLARSEIAAYFSVSPQQIVFTSGGSEALATLLHTLLALKPTTHIISSELEHAALYAPLNLAQKNGARVQFLKGNESGAPTAQEVEEAILPDTSLIALMAVNNETGVKTRIDEIAAVARQKQIPFIVDGVAWLGKEKASLPDGVSAACFSGHKFHAPKGVGFIVLKDFEIKTPLVLGGEQEMGMRGGTPNVNAISAMSEAISLLNTELPGATFRMQRLKDLLEKRLQEGLNDVFINGLGERICNTSNLSFEGVEGETLLARLDIKGLAVSHGSACSSGALEPSRVLLNMGLKRQRAQSAIRFSLSRFTTEEEIQEAAQIVIETVNQLRKF